MSVAERCLANPHPKVGGSQGLYGQAIPGPIRLTIDTTSLRSSWFESNAKRVGRDSTLLGFITPIPIIRRSGLIPISQKPIGSVAPTSSPK